MNKIKKFWYVCKNSNNMFFVVKSKCMSLHEFWQREGFVLNAVYGPCKDKKQAIEYRNDLIDINKDIISFDKPKQDSIITNFDDGFDDNDYSGLISSPES